ncbi:MAG: SIMPL domain-containing protein [Acidobacteria bacterium]|nr:SIMPL domain-containing protein [Acidobacteriota bacterium]
MNHVLLVTALALVIPAVTAAQQPRSEPLVMTTGAGVLQVVPDRAFVSVTAESRAANPRDAQRRNTEAMTPVLEKLRAAGIPADAIRTTAYDLQPEWDFVDNRRVSRGYVARNTVDVRIDTVDRVGEILEVAVGSGATTLGGVRFDLKDRASHEREALRLAVADARAKADAVAVAAGQSVSRIVRIEEQGVVSSAPMAFRVAAQELSRADAPPISAGEMEIRAQVTLTVELK